MHFSETSDALALTVQNPNLEKYPNIQETRKMPTLPTVGFQCVCTNTLDHYPHASLMPKLKHDFHAFQT
jgi:hypothetical protein